MSQFSRIYAEHWPDYELIDAGGGKKLERFGSVVVIRPEVQAYFKAENTYQEWKKIAHAEFIETAKNKGNWNYFKENIPKFWKIRFEKTCINLQFTQFKHLGVFPEQIYNWKIIQSKLKKDDTFLNLFAYTGLASLIARHKEAQVTHVDSVKHLITWSKSNMEESNLTDIKWVLEDALKFAQKEVRREKKYNGIIMDPPAFGLGSKGEKWILEQKIEELLKVTKKLLAENGFLIVNTYSPKISAEYLSNLAKSIFLSKSVKVNELWMKSTSFKDLYYGNVLYVGSVENLA
jgi:23S rRNA (cytosine1962-C5)-methyltransferase